MSPEKVIKSILDVWMMKGLIRVDERFFFEQELYQCYAAGYDEGRKSSGDNKRSKVAKLNDKGEIVEIYSSTIEAARKNDLTKSMISKLCLGKCHTTRKTVGFHFKYIE